MNSILNLGKKSKVSPSPATEPPTPTPSPQIRHITEDKRRKTPNKIAPLPPSGPPDTFPEVLRKELVRQPAKQNLRPPSPVVSQNSFTYILPELRNTADKKEHTKHINRLKRQYKIDTETADGILKHDYEGFYTR